ncbi:MAG: hypothetical protein WKF86_09025 [Acidimicrobiales bacterium]
MGPTVLLIGVVGLLLGNDPVGGALNIDLLEDFIHLSSGALLIYLGFASVPDHVVRAFVGGLGVVYLAVGVLGFVIPDVFGLIPHEYSGLDNAIHLVLGIFGIGAAAVSAPRVASSPGS